MEAKKTFHYRLLECIPGGITWSLIILPFILYFIDISLAAIFFLIYIELWFFRSMKFSFQLIYAWYKNIKYQKINFKKYLEYFSDNPPEAKIPMDKLIHKDFFQRIENFKKAGDFKKAEDILHVVIMPTYKEDIDILRESIKALYNSDYPKDKIYLVLATEERDKDRAEEYSKILKEEFSDKFGDFYSFMHPKDIEGEIIGKGGNISYSGKKIAKIVKEKGIDFSNVLVTTLDADNLVSNNYFLSLTYHYLITENRKQKSYQPLTFFYNNIWQVPVFSRLVAISNSFWHMIQAVSIRRLRNFSSHAQSLDALYEMDFWSVTSIVEDGHQFWRAYFCYDGDHFVVPIFVSVYQDAVQGKTYFGTIAAQYKQLRRWASGCSDIPFVIESMKKKKGLISFYRNFDVLFNLIEGHVMWATAPVILTFASIFPKIIKNFSDTVVIYNIANVFGILFSVAIIGIFISLSISLVMLPKPPKGVWYKIISVLQWILLPFITMIFGAFPAIDAQTRLLFGKYLGFNVTEKWRV